MTNEIKYKLKSFFEDKDNKNGRNICFEIVYPHKYSSYKEATKNNANIRAFMDKKEDGSVEINLYEKGVCVDTIKWEDWQKYRCFRLKENCTGKTLINNATDYEPCAETFEEIFEHYISNSNQKTWHMHNIAFEIIPVCEFIENDMNFATCNENVIEFYRNNNQASVTFTQGRFINKIKKYEKEYSDECQILSENMDGSIFAHIPTNWIRISPPRKMSEEDRQAAKERLSKYWKGKK
jgi:hypothetical protein